MSANRLVRGHMLAAGEGEVFGYGMSRVLIIGVDRRSASSSVAFPLLRDEAVAVETVERCLACEADAVGTPEGSCLSAWSRRDLSSCRE